MGQDRDIMFLAFLTRQPEGSADADEISQEFGGMSDADLASLVRRGLIKRVTPGGKVQYVITQEGTRFQEGD